MKKKAEKTVTVTVDEHINAEIEAMQAILAALMPLTDRQRARVIWYVTHYFQIG